MNRPSIYFRCIAKIGLASYAMVTACLSFAQAEATAERVHVIENRHIARRISADGRLETLSIENKLAGRTFRFEQPDEFRIVLDGGKLELMAKDFEGITVEQATPTRFVAYLSDPDSGVKARVSYWIPDNAHWIAKKLDVEPGGHLVNIIEVERLPFGNEAVFERFDVRHESFIPWDWPAGRPVFIDRQIFAGLEYPAGCNETSRNGVLRLYHHPGRIEKVVASKTAVIGVAPDQPGARVEDAFSLYLGRIRMRPPSRFILWDAYFHRGALSDEAVRKKIDDARLLFGQPGQKLDATLIDGGWSNPRSLMEEDPGAPGRIDLVRRLSRERLGAPIGLHVISHGVRHTIDKKWLAANFDMINGEAYCFADNRAADLQIKNLLDLLARYNIAAFKFDWGRFACGQRGHKGHIDGESYAREAITDNHIRMLTAIHEADPDVFLYNTGWYSPWWLMHYDAIYSGEDDYNTVLIGAPATTINNLQLSWRDQVIYRNIVEPRTQFPLNSAMNHSPITYKWTDDRHKSDQGPLSSYADVFLFNFLRGSAFIEMYMNLSNFDEQHRKIWAQVSAWALANDRILLADTRHIGGEPFKDEVYGYAHFAPNNDGIIGIRNPSLSAKPFVFTLDEAVGFHPGGGIRGLRVAYPYESSLGQSFRYGGRVEIPAVERASVMILECVPPAAVGRTVRPQPAKPAATVTAWEAQPGSLSAELSIQVPSGASYSLVTLARVDSYRNQGGIKEQFTVDGAPALARRSQNAKGFAKPRGWEPRDGWVVNELPLEQGKRTVSLRIDGAQGTIEAWIAAEGPQDDALPAFRSGLPAAWKNAARVEWPLQSKP